MKHKRLIIILSVVTAAILSAVTVLSYFGYPISRIGALISGNEIYRFNKENTFVCILDVGEAQAVLLYSRGDAMLIDTGNANGRAAKLISNFGIRKLDAVLLSHFHADHAGGTAGIINRFKVENIYLPNLPESDAEDYDFAYNLRSNLQELNSEVKTCVLSDIIKIGAADVSVMFAGQNSADSNERSLIVRIDVGKTSIIIMGDAGIDAEKQMLYQNIDVSADVLVAGHHGSASSTGNQFLEAVGCKHVIVSCGVNNLHGHPSSEFCERVIKSGAQLFRTDQDGNIRIDIDQNKYSIISEN